jgi:energy-coupling factor transporter transmembrane protein EcfT
MSAESRTLHFDPRTKLFAVLLLGALTFTVTDAGVFLLLTVVSVYLLVQGMYKKTLKFLLGFGILFGLQYLIYTYLTGAAAFFGFVIFIIARFIPVLMAASALSAAPSGELIAALQKLHIPKAVIIPLAVGLRFMPSISKEFSAIRDAMRLRGISLASLNTLAHPIITAECVLVPLLIRSMKVSDELGASTTARGIDNPGPRTCLRQLHFRLWDGIALLAFSAVGIIAGMFFT